MAFDLVEVEGASGQRIYIQVDRELRLRPEHLGGQPGFAPAGLPTPEQVVERFEQLAQHISQRSAQFITRLQELGAAVRPTKAALEFAIGVEGSAGIPFLAAGKGSANITITVEWSSATGS